MSPLATLALAAMLRIDRPIETEHELYEDAVVRWGKIAESIAYVAENPPPAWRWRGELGRLQLVRAEVTIMHHESHFSERVHSGVKRGGGAVCLTQIDPMTAKRFGFEPESLLGLDDASTRRCVYASVTILAKSRELAEARCSDAKHWFAPSVAAYGSGSGCVPAGKWAKGVAARMTTYNRTGDRRAIPWNIALLMEPT